MGRSWVPVIATALALEFALSGCTSAPGPPARTRGPAQIAGFRAMDRSVVLVVRTCHGDPEVTRLVQGESRIEVAVTSTTTDPGDACLDEVPVELDAPLDGRVVIDASTGSTVERVG